MLVRSRAAVPDWLFAVALTSHFAAPWRSWAMPNARGVYRLRSRVLSLGFSFKSSPSLVAAT